jgi:hypothetical protein
MHGTPAGEFYGQPIDGPMKTSTLFKPALIFFFLLNYSLFGQTEDVSKIYLLGSTLIRSTPGKAIRFYDIANPRRPKMRSSIAVPGNHDIAIHSRYMYADNGNDLVIYDIKRIRRPLPIDTITGVFNQYQVADVPEFAATDSKRSESRSFSSGPSGNGAAGKAGSLARFAIIGRYLYCIDYNRLVIFDITKPSAPRLKNSVTVGVPIETLFPYREKLFIGGNFGMYIYNLDNPEQPVYISQFQHLRSCDPVVVEGNRAYVTVRGNSRCGQSGNELHILDISTIETPKLLKTVPLTGPFGLAVRNKRVIVCDGGGGLRTFDARNPNKVKQMKHLKGIVPYDVILDRKLMVVTTASGFYLYNANLTSPKLYGKLKG